VAGRDPRDELRPAELDAVAVAHDPIGPHRRKEETVLELRVVVAAPFEQRRIALARDELRTRSRLHPRETARVVLMRLAHEEVANVFDTEAQLANGALDDGHRFDEPGVDEDVPFRGRDEKRRDLVRAHVVHVSDDVKRLDGPVRRPRRLVGLPEQGRGDCPQNPD
jgi:hypothetical protein